MTTAKPLTPAQALASLQVEAGLRVELAAAEPLTASPVALAWDERGRMFVAENRGYPVGPGTNKPPAGIIAMLEDTNGDGTYDKRTEFATGLTFPNGLMCWRGGLIVTCAPDIFYLKDTDGDGKADVKRVLLTSFGTTSTTQLRVSHPTLGLDGWIHVTSGLVASKVTCPEHPERGEIALPRGDARFHPDTLEIEPWPGVGQFGLAFDDFGRKFTCSNRNPLQHVVLHPRYLKRNPHLAFSDTVQDVAPPGDAAKVWPLSADHTTAAFIPSLMSTPHAGTFTSACGISLWRGGALPAAFANSAFICEPAQNLVQRQVLTPDGPTFKSAPATPGREFLASADTWFRPVFSATGPDGALYICDMYRKVIDHPQYLPEFIRGTLDYEAGKTMGRIYRVTATSSKTQAPSSKLNLAAASTKELVAKLTDANGWVRTTGFRLLVERNDPQTPSSLAKLTEKPAILRGTIPESFALATALRLLDRQGLLQEHVLLGAMTSDDPEVAVTAIEIAEPIAEKTKGKVREQLRTRNYEEAPRVSFRRALALGDVEGSVAVHTLAAIVRNSTDRWLRAAVFSSIGNRTDEFLRDALEQWTTASNTGPTMRELGQILPAAHQRDDLQTMLARVLASNHELNVPSQSAFATGLGNGARAKGLGKDGRSALVTLASANPDTARRLGELFAAASKTVATASAPTPERLAAIDLLAHSDAATAGAALQSLIAPQTPNELQAAAVRALSQLPGAKAGEWFVERERWRSYTPPVRDAVLTAMLSQPALQLVLLGAVEKGVVQPWAVPANRRNPLLKHRDVAVAARATKAFQPQGAADRMKVYEDHKAVLTLPANAKNGKAVFVKTCAACHQFAGEGARVGPELTGVRLQPAEAILLHILVPDAEIYPGFTAYEVETKDSRSLTGLLTSDTPTSVTLRAAQGIEETILRSNIAKLTSSSISLMPNELEKTMTRQELADLMAFLKGQ
ncbi:MAG: membrane-bound dehydrogenase [Limisphaerales bacterium]|nr:MAG: membrane-bound dehydrogenase [Limisphaerales bacterium]KAG0508540.1 MAG: membrane-bound dehydrogenase [Limisphaerales bacterium]TXT50148.1 MAG: membrane-bound dehydrogenase [Limisphaerales bacterium]